ncbi:DUF6130 family protein [Pantoea sp. EA-12]|uniref:DUF6130 family protein n=1 Tax=Pantoea sp. EA-12 TaxID=3043303 RepID=UPI0024B4B1B2|nr:DUF6130 family protein [Pantoea sp. EA-12]MDI9221361.1 DUF6130 family protein [Pantoea sp. EA-12]
MNSNKFVVSFFFGLLSVFSTGISFANSDGADVATKTLAAASPKPKLNLYAPRADFLKDGYVYIQFDVENLQILPLYTEINGEDATKLKPTIGHLHVMVDGSGWSWIHADYSPIYFGPLKRGEHLIRIELVDASHSIIQVKTIKVNVP